MGQRLAGKVAIVTGASKGIGAAIAKMFADEGAKVVVNYYKSEEQAREVAAQIKESGGKCLLAKADVSKTPDVKRMVSKAVGKFGRIDILVNNAGVLIAKDFLDSTDEDWDRVVDVNMKGTYLCCREVAPIMLTQKKGKIINISSVSALAQPSALKYPDYVSSKAGVIGMTRALAVRLGPMITVNAICPGTIETDILSFMPAETKQKMAEENFLKTLGKPLYVAQA
ncbi:MAG: SDR family NAD(P)-dependent oxidoreductase, partial [Thaumarchaeota archaeon]|nr:SDR family NAD(P)-dependent oxidoreductase [Nitrososphaerota archaeon]